MNWFSGEKLQELVVRGSCFAETDRLRERLKSEEAFLQHLIVRGSSCCPRTCFAEVNWALERESSSNQDQNKVLIVMSSQRSKTQPQIRPSKGTPKMADPYLADYTSPLQPPQQQQPADYVPLPLIGQIKEKGFSASSRQQKRISVPEPRATPFPIARHRSEGPHWAPVAHQPVAAEEDKGEVGVEHLAAQAQPIERKKKRGVDLSRWKQDSNANTKDQVKSVPKFVKVAEGEKDSWQDTAIETESMPSKLVAFRSHSNKEIDDTAVSTLSGDNCHESEGEKVDTACQRVLTGTKGMLESSSRIDTGESGGIRDMRDSSTSCKVVEASKIDSRGKSTGFGQEIEEIDAENRLTLQSMTNEEIVEAQAEITQRLRPDILDLLRRRGVEKARRHREEQRVDAARIQNGEHAISDSKIAIGFTEPLSLAKGSEAHDSSSMIDENRDHGDTVVALSAGGGVFAEGADHSISQTSTSAAQTESAALIVTGSGKKSWSDRVEAVRLLKFGLDGNIVGVESATATTSTGDTSQWNVHNVAERDFLRTEGNPAGEGYTIKEAVALVRSMVPAQRSAALRLLALVLDKALTGLQLSDTQRICASAHKSNESVDWQAVWAYALGPEPELVLTLRIALDDSHATVVATCAKVLQCLLSSSANEHYFNLCEALWPGDKYTFTAPIFRKSTKQEEGFIGGGHWKYNVKPSNMFPFSKPSDSEKPEEDATVSNDAAIANQDVAAGLIRMGILPRIRYILEVEKLVAAEEQLFNVLIALSRHSPTTADAVMKCPRLMDTVLQLFLQNKNTNTGVWRAQPKAIHLLKVLSQARKSNCIKFMEMGLFQAAQHELLQQGLILGTQNGACQGLRGLSTGLVESLQLWRVCIQYQVGVSFFSDFYPALLFWVSPPSIEDIQHNLETVVLAQVSFALLEKFAMTLPILHGDKQSEGQETDVVNSETSLPASSNWSWNYAIPIVETSLGWLSYELISSCNEKLQEFDESKQENVTLSEGTSMFLRTLASVLHFLSTVCERILQDDILCIPNNNECQTGDSKSLWLPTFVPKLGLQLVKSGLLNCMKNTRKELQFLSKKDTSFVECFLGLKKRIHGDALLMSTNCLHGLVRLVKVLDRLMECARTAASSILSYEPNESSEADEVLAHGLALSAEGELMGLLTIVGDDVIQKSQNLQMVGTSGRGGPAPGVGVGWGCAGGGYWSWHVLVAQTEALLTTELSEVFPRQRDAGVLGTSVSKSAAAQKDFCTDEGENNLFIVNAMWKINLGLSVAALAGPGSADLVERVCSSIILHESALKLLIEQTDIFLRKWLWKVGRGQYLQTRDSYLSNLKSKLEEMKGFLQQHFRSVWLGRKIKAARSKKQEEFKQSGKVKKVEWSCSLSTVYEDSKPLSAHVNRETLATEWAGQRLPLPSHWLVSPLSVFVESYPMASGNAGRGYELSDGVEQYHSVNGDALKERSVGQIEVIRHGLLLLCGLEAIADKVEEPQQLGVCCIPLARKIHALSTVFVVADDVFLHNDVRNMIGALQEFFGELLDSAVIQKHGTEEVSVSTQDGATTPGISECSKDGNRQHLLDFEELVDERYSSFAEGLAHQFGSVSFGDLVFGRQVAIYLRRDVADSLRLKIWGVLEGEHVLELLPTLEQCCGHCKGYLYPFEENQEILKSYVSAWASGALDRAVACNSVTFSLALYHVAAFLFIRGNQDEKLLLRKTLARSLIIGLTHRPLLQGSLLQLLKCDLQFISALSSHEAATVFDSASSQELLAMRCLFFHEACVGFPALVAAVQRLEKMVYAQV